MTHTAGFGPGAPGRTVRTTGHGYSARPRRSYDREAEQAYADWASLEASDAERELDYVAGKGGMARALHAVGAVASIALVVGVGIWGYAQVKRDVSGVPVVVALEGPMRVAPERPGGTISEHVGLAVNAVKSQGTVAAPSETLRLAPDASGLAAEDLPAPELAPVMPDALARAPGEAQSSPITPQLAPMPDVAGPRPTLFDASLRAPAGVVAARGPDQAVGQTHAAAIAQALAGAGIAPGAPSADPAGTPATLEPDLTALEPALAPDTPGLARSPRPAPRPASRSVLSPATAPLAPLPVLQASASVARAPAVIANTRLVQLGAYFSQGDAEAAWGEIVELHGPLLLDKAPVIQTAQTGGQTFWRLRVSGFEDLADARRFCTALMAEQTDCIPVPLQ